MKRLQIIVFVLFLIAGGFQSVAQNPGDSTRIEGYIPIYHSDKTSWIKRYQHDIDKYQEENRKLTDFSCDVLMLGSSSINLWNNIYNDLAPLKIIRRSYGGSTIRDQIYNYNTIARGYHPKKIAVYVENDLGGNERITIGECYDLYRLFFQMLRRDYPEAVICYISMKPSFAKADQLKDQLVFNALMEDYVRNAKGFEYIDITAGMYDEKGNLREDIFIEDRLHLNQKGYDIWKEVIRPVLQKGL